MSSDVMIQANGLGKSYRRYPSEGQRLRNLLFGTAQGEECWVLRDVDFQVTRGEAVGIVGRNGAGKSTLLKIISGTLTPSTGNANVAGRVGTLLELGAGLHPDYTGRENARFTAAIMGMTKRQFAQVADDIESFADIGSFFDRNVSEYSSGMFARLAFSVNIHCKPDVLIVDEILSVGDISFQHKCIRFMRQFCADGGTLLFVSHDDAAVRALCDRAIWLDGGQLSAEGSTERVLRQYHTMTWKLQFGSETFMISEEGDEPMPPPWEDDEPTRSEQDRFDPEKLPEYPVAGEFTAVELRKPGGGALSMAEGGRQIELRARVRPDETLENPAVCFLLRNRLAQLLFGARTDAGSDGPAILQAGQQAEAQFVFTLPYVPTGEYTIEPVLVATVDGRDQIVMRHEQIVLPVKTVHISQGLANVAMKQVMVQIQDEGGKTV